MSLESEQILFSARSDATSLFFFHDSTCLLQELKMEEGGTILPRLFAPGTIYFKYDSTVGRNRILLILQCAITFRQAASHFFTQITHNFSSEIITN
jgi:hypothetical protein